MLEKTPTKDTARTSADPSTRGHEHRQAHARFSIDEFSPALGATPLQLSALDTALLQFRASVTGRVEASAAADVQSVAAAGIQGGGGALPHADRIQAAFGRHDIGGIRAHTGGEAKAAAGKLGARGYATGSDVVLTDASDLHTAAHEAAHVVQQRGGVQLSGGVGQAGDTYEQHADAVADAVVQGRSAESLLDRFAGGGSPSGAVQLQGDEHVDAVLGAKTLRESRKQEAAEEKANAAKEEKAEAEARAEEAWVQGRSADKKQRDEAASKEKLTAAETKAVAEINAAVSRCTGLSRRIRGSAKATTREPDGLGRVVDATNELARAMTSLTQVVNNSRTTLGGMRNRPSASPRNEAAGKLSSRVGVARTSADRALKAAEGVIGKVWGPALRHVIPLHAAIARARRALRKVRVS